MDYTQLDGLTSEEMRSILKSNIISWNIRRKIKILMNQKILEEFVPVVASIAVASIIMDIFKNR